MRCPDCGYNGALDELNGVTVKAIADERVTACYNEVGCQVVRCYYCGRVYGWRATTFQAPQVEWLGSCKRDALGGGYGVFTSAAEWKSRWDAGDTDRPGPTGKPAPIDKAASTDKPAIADKPGGMDDGSAATAGPADKPDEGAPDT